MPVEPLVFDLLMLLVRNAGALVTRDRMIEDLWQGRFVSDSAISACIAAARRAVGDDGKRQAVIETVPRRGLKFVAAVENGSLPVAQLDAASPQGNAVPSPNAPIPAPRLRYTRNGRGQSVAWARSGKGSPVAYLGYSSTDVQADWNSACFRPLFEVLSARHSLLRFDPVGTGRSDLDLPDDFSLEDEAEDLRAVLDAAGIDKAALFAQSGGCLATLIFAARYPERVSRLVVNGGYAEGRARRSDAGGTEQIRGLISEGWTKPASSFSLAFSALYLPEGPLNLADELVTLMRNACPVENMLKIRDAVNAASVVDLLPRITCPVLILHSRGDSVHPLEQAQKLAASIPDAELAILETANHVPLPGNATWEPFLSMLLDFLGD